MDFFQGCSTVAGRGRGYGHRSLKTRPLPSHNRGCSIRWLESAL